MKALVTGGTGLVGRYIVETLLDAGYEVTVTGRRPPADDLFSPACSVSLRNARSGWNRP
jgi:UDP-glucose 4-epimerase